MATTLYDSFLDDLSKGNIVPGSDTFKVMLTTSSYTPNRATHTKRSDVTNEVTGTAYVAGGAASTCTEALDTSGHKVTYTYGNVTWTTATIAAFRYAVIYKSRGGASSADNLVGWIDFVTDQSVSAANLTLTFTAPITGQA